MDNENIRISKNFPGQMNQQMNMDQMRMTPQSGGSSKLPWAILAAVVIVLGGTGVVFRDRLFNSSSNGKVQGAMSSKPSGYQSVFLTNGQVYFGKIADINGQYVTLSDIYYLQVTQPPLQGSQQNNNQQSQQQPQVSLVKLGNELHGPVDEMKINRDQILFFEDMKDDSKVMQAIREYKANPNGASGNQQQAPAANQQGGAANQAQPAVNGASTTNTQPQK